jgi:hypothetical protein
MTLAEQRYCGQEGADYWERNRARLDDERPLRGIALRSLVPVDYATCNWLEVGGGRGHNLYPGDVCLDCDPRQLAARWEPEITPIIGHAYNLSIFPNNAFSVALSVGCLMHLPTCRAGERYRHLDCHTWNAAVEEMARVSSKYVILGEYVSEEEKEVLGHHWDGCLWSRPYTVPGMTLLTRHLNLEPFDKDVTFLVFGK